jgi:hypothetical protein
VWCQQCVAVHARGVCGGLCGFRRKKTKTQFLVPWHPTVAAKNNLMADFYSANEMSGVWPGLRSQKKRWKTGRRTCFFRVPCPIVPHPLVPPPPHAPPPPRRFAAYGMPDVCLCALCILGLSWWPRLCRFSPLLLVDLVALTALCPYPYCPCRRFLASWQVVISLRASH